MKYLHIWVIYGVNVGKYSIHGVIYQQIPPPNPAWAFSFLRFPARSPISRLWSAATLALRAAAFAKAARTAADFSCGQQVFYHLYYLYVMGLRTFTNAL